MKLEKDRLAQLQLNITYSYILFAPANGCLRECIQHTNINSILVDIWVTMDTWKPKPSTAEGAYSLVVSCHHYDH